MHKMRNRVNAMKIAMFWAQGESGSSLLAKFVDAGSFVYLYGDAAADVRCDSGNYELQPGAPADEGAIEHVIAKADLVVCSVPAGIYQGKKKDVSTPYADSLTCILHGMKACGKSRIFLALPVIEEDGDEKHFIRSFCNFFRKVRPHGYRDSRKCYDELLESGTEYTVIRYFNPYLKKAKGGYTFAEVSGKIRAGISAENLAQCLFDTVTSDGYKMKMPIAYNSQQS